MISLRSFLLLANILVLLLPTSCSVEKRRHLSGYHIEWNRAKANVDKTKQEGKSAIKDENVRANNQIVIVEDDVYPELEASLYEPMMLHDKEEELDLEKKEDSFIESETYRKAEKKLEKKTKNKTDEKKVNGLAVASFVLSLLFILIFPSILAIIFGSMARKEIGENPSKYKGKWMAEVGYVFGIVMTSIFLTVLIFFIWWASG